MDNFADISIASRPFGEWQSTDPEREVAVLMSGGVDSSTTALLLQRRGWRVLGITMEIPVAEGCSYAGTCCGGQAAVVSHHLGIPHYFLDTDAAFRELVIERFRQSYQRGYTPNPCADCNELLKFRAVWDFIEQQFGVYYLATGHYAQVRNENGTPLLSRGEDTSRDQSYFIYGVPRNRIPHLLLPMGTLAKDEVRRIAADAAIPVADRADSMELCFAGEDNYRKALKEAAMQPGDIVNLEGECLGRHNGIENYTVGQRRGLGIAAGEPLYVIKLCPEDNTVVVGTREQAFQSRVKAVELNVLMPESMTPGIELLGKIRSYSSPAACNLVNVKDDRMTVEFQTPQFGPAPGQRLVLYDEEGHVVAGGRISA